MTQQQAEFVDLYRAGLKTAADLMKASLQNVEKLQNQQLVVIRNALDQQAKAIGELSQARTIDEVLAVQTRMAGAQWERAVGFWSELWQTQLAQGRDWINETSQAANTGVRQVQRQQEQHRKSA
jgi:phasin family protein